MATRLTNPLRLASYSSDPGSPSAGDTYWNTTSKVAKTYDGGAWQTYRPRGYTGMYLTADLNPGNSTTTVNTLSCTLDANSDASWSVVTSTQLTPPSGTIGLWVASVNMRFQSSAASLTTSYRRIQATGVKTSPAHKQALAVAENLGHRQNIELDMYASGQAFDITLFDYIQLDVMVVDTTGNTVFALNWTGPSGVWDQTSPATFLTLERV
jgi:hypothetical protein